MKKEEFEQYKKDSLEKMSSLIDMFVKVDDEKECDSKDSKTCQLTENVYDFRAMILPFIDAMLDKETFLKHEIGIALISLSAELAIEDKCSKEIFVETAKYHYERASED